MAYSFIANVAAGSGDNDSVTTGAIDTSGASILFVGVSDAFGVAPSDSKGNTWTGTTNRGSAPFTRIYYCASPSVGVGHTFSVTSSGDFPSIFVMAFSGSKASLPFDVENGNTSTGTTTTQGGSVTPSEDNEVIISLCGTNLTANVSVDSGFTRTDFINNTGHNYAGGFAYLIQTTATAKNPTWTGANTSERSVSNTTFKAAAGGSGGGPLIRGGSLTKGSIIRGGRLNA